MNNQLYSFIKISATLGSFPLHNLFVWLLKYETKFSQFCWIIYEGAELFDGLWYFASH
jgi:hypothetical protein